MRKSLTLVIFLGWASGFSIAQVQGGHESVQDAIRFERQKDAAAARQARIESRSTASASADRSTTSTSKGAKTTRFQAAHVERATARAREAVKQCGASWAPAVGAPVTLAEALRPNPAHALRLMADPDGGLMPPLRDADAVQWIIGPEGGFTDAEQAQIRAAGFRPVALGRATLRFDTAATAALAVTAMARAGR